MEGFLRAAVGLIVPSRFIVPGLPQVPVILLKLCNINRVWARTVDRSRSDGSGGLCHGNQTLVKDPALGINGLEFQTIGVKGQGRKAKA